MLLSVCLTSAYSVRLSVFTLWSPFKSGSSLLVGDSSLFVYFSLFLLSVGGITGGCVFSWLLCPFVGVLALPFYLKIAALSFIFLLGLVFFFLVDFGFLLVGSFFMGSMWFLGFITSPPVVGVGFRVGRCFYNQELTWLHLLSGSGSMFFFRYISSLFQLGQGLGFSYLFSFFSGLVLLFFLVV